MQVSVWREHDAMRRRGIGFEVIPRSFHDEKETIPASLQPRVLTAIYGPGLKRFDAKRWSASDAGGLKGSAKENASRQKQGKEQQNAPCRHERPCPPLLRGGRQRNADHFPARIRRRLHQLGAADALLLAPAPLHRLFSARLRAVGSTAVGRGLHLQA